MTKYKIFDRRSMCVTLCVHLILLCDFVYRSRVQCIVPLDLKPISTYDIGDTTSYPIFSGVCDTAENTLEDIQGVKKINDTYYVYARDYIYVVGSSVQSNGTTKLVCSQTIHLPSPDDTVSLCKRKGQSAKNCHNYVKLFEQVKSERGVPTNKVLVCGTNSFDPTCLFYMIQNNGHLTALKERAMPGNLACPFDPNDSLASVMSGGNLYTATQSNFGGHDALIYRSSMANNNDKNLRTIKGDTTILNDPDFVQLVDGGLTNKMFVFFTETAIEDNSDQVYSRIGQMCKNDQGGQIVLRNQFSSFFKARLNCSLPGQPPFYFNELRDVSKFVTLQLGDDPKENVVFAIMNTPRNSIPASAICVFTAKDIQAALTGPFNQKQTVENSHFTYWDKLDKYPKPHLAECGSVGGRRSLNMTQSNFVRKHPMMYNSIPAWNLLDDLNETPLHNSHPIFSRTTARNFLTSIAVDTMAGFVELYTVVLAGTEDGKVIKIVILKNKSVSVVEERVIFNEEKCGSVDKSVRSITINRENGTMLVTFRNCFVSAPLCPLVGVCARTCIASRDPYCLSDGKTCLSSHQRSSGNSTKTQVFNSVDTGNVDRLPPCPKSANPGDDVDTEMTSTVQTPTTTENKNGTIEIVPTPVKVEAASMEGWILPVLIPSMFVMGLIAGLCICMLIKKDGRCIKKNINTKKRTTNGKLPNGQSRDNRRDSNYKKSTSSRRESANSQARHDELSRRSRKITENSVNNKSDEEQDVFSDTPDSPNKRMSDTFRKKHLSVSSQGGRRRARNSKPSTSSGPEADEALLSSSQKSQYQMEDQNTRGSSDSGHSSEGLIVPPENIYSQSVPPTTMPNQRHRGPPMRSASFAGPQNIPRSHTMDNYSRNGRRPPMDRQLSLQGMRPMYPTNPTFRHQQPHTPMGPPWPHTAQPVVQVTPNNKQYGGPTNRMTASLDRRMMKNKGHYQATPGDVFNDEPMSNNGPYQSNRKRYASESIGMQNPQMTPSQYQPMRDEPKLLPINEEHHLPDDHQMIDKNRLRLNIPNAQDYDNRSSNSAPIGYNRSQPMEGVPVMGPRGPFFRRNPASNPGTPMREMPPNFVDIVNSNKGHATLPTNPKIQQRFQPQSLNFDKRLSNHPSGDTSPTKSTPSSPMSNAYFSFPNQEKIRHSSGQMKSLTPTSGENTSFLNPQTPGSNSQRSRHSSGPTRTQSGQAGLNDIPMNTLSTNNRTIVT